MRSPLLCKLSWAMSSGQSMGRGALLRQTCLAIIAGKFKPRVKVTFVF